MTRAPGALEELVVCSLERWDEVWRRNQFLTDALLRRNPALRVLFVEPPADPLFDLRSRRRPALPTAREIGYGGRLRAVRPLKALPRRVGPVVDASLRRQVRLAVRAARLSQPTLWLNDVTYAPLTRQTGWPTLYDVTDDWLAAPLSRRELGRIAQLEQEALESAGTVVVCSNALARSRGRSRRVVLVPNAVDVDHFRRDRPRPADLPDAPVAVYAGTLHESRFDVELTLEVARALPSLQLVLVGPVALDGYLRARLRTQPNIRLLGPRPYEDVPGYLQHADVILVPHLVNEFTDSLDPIKAYECLASGTPTVATPVAGFRELHSQVCVAPRETFPTAVDAALGAPHRVVQAVLPTWAERAEAFEDALLRSGDASA